ncbi:gluconate 2-dehydrogenase subunit 3 family protein [Pedobacter nanyangensis]|uniref:gluconate 2-dehydrogenase subunit 3 family protein n=1 Tax=Pedobacter nanyangensis TaxID=1562389 RepID=UPI000DE3CA4B|nr:gluconate 2-dehydrogenase subunit 3 family protein [Pedobacter nanyangensis]
MERRTAIRHMALLCASAMLLPSCFNHQQEASIPLQQIAISAKQEQLLAELVETIIPKTDTLGAKDLGLHLFVLKMVDDCLPQKEQQQFMDGLQTFEDKTIGGTKFAESSNQHKINLLKEIMEPRYKESNLQFFLKEVRKQTLKGYQQSEYVMTKLRPYILVPGHFSGSVKRA